MALNNETYYSTAATRHFRAIDKQTLYPLEAWYTLANNPGTRRRPASAGTQSAHLCTGGFSNSSTYVGDTTLFNGNGWQTLSGSLNTSREGAMGCGVFNSALAAGGNNGSTIGSTELFNGSTWSTSGALADTTSYAGDACGSQTAAVVMGGTSAQTSIQLFSGSSWSNSSASMPTLHQNCNAIGTSKSSLCVSGYNTSVDVTVVDYYNGSTCTTIGSNLVARSNHGATGVWANATIWGGAIQSGLVSATLINEKYNGAVWSASISHIALVEYTSSAGTGSAAIACGGDNSVVTALNTAYAYLRNPSFASNSMFKGLSQFQTGGDIIATEAGYYLLDEVLAPSSAFDGAYYDEVTLGLVNDPSAGGWASTGSLNTARRYTAGAGTPNAGLSFGGNTTGIGTQSTTCEKYGGSSWVSANAMNTAKDYTGGAGTQVAAVSVGGNGSALIATTETFNGTSWTAAGNMTSAALETGNAGVLNALVSFGGSGSGGATTIAEIFNGSTWASTGSMNTPSQSPAAAGSQYGAIKAGGYNSGVHAVVELFNGLIWATNSASLPIATNETAGSGAQNSCRVFGGAISGGAPTNSTYYFNGVAWAITATKVNTTSALAGCGTGNQAISFGGYISGPTSSASCEKYLTSLPDVAFSSQGSWGLGPTYPATVDGSAGLGSVSAGVNAGGNSSAPVNTSYLFNGVAWTASGNLTGVNWVGGMACGIQAAGLIAGGSSADTQATALNTSQTFNGSTWTASGTLTTTRANGGVSGTTGAAVAFAGTSTSTILNSTESFNGATWASVVGGNLATARELIGTSSSSSSSVLACCGTTNGSGSGFIASTEVFNGSTWSAGTSFPFSCGEIGSAGSSASLLISGGILTSGVRPGLALKYNGAVWSSAATCNVTRSYAYGAGSASSAFVVGGNTPSDVSSVELYTNTATDPIFVKYVVN